METYRLSKKYYEITDPKKREAADALMKAEIDKTRSSLSAAWTKANAAAANTPGYSCATTKCTKMVASKETLCCGTATKKTGAAAFVPAAPAGKICNTDAATSFKDLFGNEYTFKCGACQLGASAAAAIAVAYLM